MILGERYIVDAVMVSALFNSAAVFYFGTSVIEPLFYSCTIYTVFYLFTRGFKCSLGMPKYICKMMIFWASTLIASLVAPILFTGKVTRVEIGSEISYSIYSGNISWFRIIELFIMIVCAIFIYNAHVYTFDDIERIISIMVWITFAFAIWQYLSYFRIVPPNNVVSNIVYSNRTDSSYYNSYVRNEVVFKSFWLTRLYSTFLEPSYFSGFLIVSFYVLIRKEIFDKANLIKLIIVGFMGMMTLSATAYAGFVVATLLVVIQKYKERTGKNLIVYGTLLLIAFGIIISKYNLWGIINNMVINKASSYSYMIRDTWNQSALNVFIRTYGLGLGFKNARGSGLIHSLLAQFGWIGTVYFFSVFISLIREISIYFIDENTKNVSRSIIVLIIIQMSISIGILQYSIFWMIVLLVSAILYNCEDMNNTIHIEG